MRKLKYGILKHQSDAYMQAVHNLQVIVIIPTKCRTKQIETALLTVLEQTRPPDELIVVGDSETDFPSNYRLIENKFTTTKVSWIINERTANLSGAVNTAVQFIISKESNPQNTYFALLDDDDRWEPVYLQTLTEQAVSTQPDIVISGIIRHEQDQDMGTEQIIPKSINQNMFLVGNPHIQGSNLFVKMSAFLRAGGFDENLPSCTDRDFMIRLIDLGDIKPLYIQKHLVHHYAISTDRLSSYGSASKLDGLTKFLQKYQERMTANEVFQFKERAKNLFGWNESLIEQNTEISNIPTIPTSANNHAFHLVVGFTASHLSCTIKLLRDLSVFLKQFTQHISLVVLDNTENQKQLEQIIDENKTGLFSVKIISKNEVNQDADVGKLGSFYINRERRKGPSYGRTALHRFLYLTGLELDAPVFWIIDDDIRLNNIMYASSNQVLTPQQFEKIIDYLIDEHVSICVARVMGDPPLPIASSIRCQLLELYHYLRKQAERPYLENKPTTDLITTCLRDHYYDLSINYFDHLETPIKTTLNANRSTLSQCIDALLEGRNLLRPSLPTTAVGNMMRGGNTIVTDIECLRTHINSSPNINGIELRRGDTIWVELNRYIGGELVGYEHKQVLSLPLFLSQERAPSSKPDLLNDALAADLLGGAFVRAFTNILKLKTQTTQEKIDIDSIMRFTDEDCTIVVNETRHNLKHRIEILKMNAWRINGLISSIRNQMNVSNSSLVSALKTEEIKNITKALDWIESETSISKVHEFSQNLQKNLAEGINEYLRELRKSRQLFESNLALKANEAHKKTAQKLIHKYFNVDTPKLIGQGQEGVVYSDGFFAYKYFFSNRFQRKKDIINLINEKLKPEMDLKRIVSVEKIVIDENNVLLKMPLIKGDKYSGGRLTEIIEFLRESKKTKIVTTNICPENFLIGKNGLVYVDIGKSITHYSEILFNEMCKRAYLTYRWHFRSDLKDLLTKSLHDHTLPELFGFEEFRKAIDQVNVYDQMNYHLLEACLKSKPKNVLDFGCGAGTIANQLADYGCMVDCYDPNPEDFNAHSHRKNVTLLQLDDLDKRVKDGLGYDLVLCNLVLCTIASDIDVEMVIHKLRTLTSQKGLLIIGLCNPLADEVKTSPSQTRNVIYNTYHSHYAIVESTLKGNQRTDWHRPLSWYKHVAHKAGFEIKETVEIPSVDTERLSPSSDQILLILNPLRKTNQNPPVSLMIKTCAMEYQTIERQIRHIVTQLEGPQQFIEKIVITDKSTEGFARQYTKANMEKFQNALQKLVDEQVIDRVVVAPNDPETIKNTYRKWFGLECSELRAINGQPTHMTLYGLDQCKGDYVLQTDCDCIFFRPQRKYDYLEERISIFESDPTSVTVALPIPCNEFQPFKKKVKNLPFRVEVRCCLLNLVKLNDMLPLENEICAGQLILPWHRSLDKAIMDGKATSYRGGSSKTCFVHVPNFRKTDVNDWISILDVAESGRMLYKQLNKIQLTGDAADWLGKRDEEMVILMRGRNVPLSKVRRCLISLQNQLFKNWSAIIIDANSSNGLEDLYCFSLRKMLEDKVTYIRNHVLLTSMENIDYATSSLCTNPQSIIVHLDLDDALIGTDALSKIKEAYDKGADVTVGTILRTDKQTKYQVSFKNIRANRGGNVWQHLRTYRKYIYDMVPKEYFKVDDKWVKYSEDWAFMIPIVELARNPLEIRDEIYFYEPSENKSKKNVQDRERLITKIMAKPSLESLN